MNLKEQIEMHLMQLPPHVKERRTGFLLVEALAQIKLLEQELENIKIETRWIINDE